MRGINRTRMHQMRNFWGFFFEQRIHTEKQQKHTGKQIQREGRREKEGLIPQIIEFQKQTRRSHLPNLNTNHQVYLTLTLPHFESTHIQQFFFLIFYFLGNKNK